MNKPKEKWWSVTKFDIGRELANPDYVQWADERIAALEAGVAKFTPTNTASLKCPLHEVGKMCRVFNDKPYMCDGPACIISGALQA